MYYTLRTPNALPCNLVSLRAAARFLGRAGAGTITWKITGRAVAVFSEGAVRAAPTATKEEQHTLLHDG